MTVTRDTRRLRRWSIAGLALIALTACGGQQVGSKDLLNIKDQKVGSQLGSEPLPTPTGGAATAIHSSPVTAPTPQQAPPAHPTPTPPPPRVNRFTIIINSDESGLPDFQPQDVSFPKGTVVTWVNHDTQGRSIATEAGSPAAFTSPVIGANGGSWSWTVPAAGTYHYQDQNKTYDLGQFTAT